MIRCAMQSSKSPRRLPMVATMAADKRDDRAAVEDWVTVEYVIEVLDDVRKRLRAGASNPTPASYQIGSQLPFWTTLQARQRSRAIHSRTARQNRSLAFVSSRLKRSLHQHQSPQSQPTINDILNGSTTAAVLASPTGRRDQLGRGCELATAAILRRKCTSLELME